MSNASHNLPLDEERLAQILGVDRGEPVAAGGEQEVATPATADVISAAIDAARREHAHHPPVRAAGQTYPAGGRYRPQPLNGSTLPQPQRRHSRVVRFVRTVLVCAAVTVVGGSSYLIYKALNRPTKIGIQAHLVSSAPDPQHSGYLKEVVDIAVTNHGKQLIQDVGMEINDDSADLGSSSNYDAAGNQINSGTVVGPCQWYDDTAGDARSIGNFLDCGALAAGRTKEITFTYDIHQNSWGGARIGPLHLNYNGGYNANRDDNAIPFPGSVLKWNEKPTPQKKATVVALRGKTKAIPITNDVPASAVTLENDPYHQDASDPTRSIDAQVYDDSGQSLPIFLRLSKTGGPVAGGDRFGPGAALNVHNYAAKRWGDSDPNKMTNCRAVSAYDYYCGRVSPSNWGTVGIEARSAVADRWRLSLTNLPGVRQTTGSVTPYDPLVSGG